MLTSVKEYFLIDGFHDRSDAEIKYAVYFSRELTSIKMMGN